jgi:thermostable 8-oxoguanine DNA glycosylase
MRRCPTFKRKSVSDYMITAGISHDVIALDVRVVGALKRYLGYETPVSRVQGSKKIYLSVEEALRDVCEEDRTTLARLDRTLFQFTGMSALRYVIEIER